MKGSLILANGEKFTGQWNGKPKEHIGELIYFTGMGRFQEFITDPANKRKIVIATFPGILNSDVDLLNFESDEIQIGGLISQQDASMIMNDRSKNLLQIFQGNNIPVLTSMDTRALVKRVKKEGEMPAVITSQLQANRLNADPERYPKAPGMEYVVPNGDKHIVIVNFGYKKSLIQALSQSGHKVTAVASNIDLKQMKSLNPDGIIFTGGPGNPMNWKKFFPLYKKLAMEYPTIGLGLGHQVLALAFGAAVKKMDTGHRSFKEAVIQTDTNRVFLSSQNHGYAVDEESLNQIGFHVSFKNVHDGSVEGLVHGQFPVATYQFHPERTYNPLNDLIFNRFFQIVHDSKGARVYA